MNLLAQQICEDPRWPEIDESALHEALSNALVYGGFGLRSEDKRTLDMTAIIPEGQALKIDIGEQPTRWVVKITNPLTTQGKPLPTLAQLEKIIQEESASIGNWERTNQRGLFLINQYAHSIQVDGATLTLIFKRLVPTTAEQCRQTALQVIPKSQITSRSA